MSRIIKSHAGFCLWLGAATTPSGRLCGAAVWTAALVSAFYMATVQDAPAGRRVARAIAAFQWLSPVIRDKRRETEIVQPAGYFDAYRIHCEAPPRSCAGHSRA